MREFLFGAAYYDEYNQEDQLEKDMQLMRKAGMNAIRIAESTWSVEEPRCGEFDFSHVTRVIEAAARHGIGVIIGTPTYAIPKWLHDLDPEILGNNAFGPRQNMDITNPTYRFYAERIIRELRDYVRSGSTALATFRIFFADENLKIRPNRQPHGLTDVFSMHYSRFTKDANGTWMELLEPDGAETVSQYDHEYWGKYASATHNHYGSGHAWYLGTMPDMEALKKLLQRVCASADIPVPALRWPIVCRSVGSLCFLFNYFSKEQRISCPFNGKDVLTGKTMRCAEPLTFPRWGAMILSR